MTKDTQQLTRLHADLRVFLWLIWRHLGLPEPTPIQYDIAHYLQHGPKRAIIEAFRGVGKSFITSAFVVWTLLREPQRKIMVVSASKERADAFSIFTKRLINEVAVLQHLQARAQQRDSSVAFDVGPAIADHSPSVKSVGITGQLTGSRADIIIADDVEVPGNSATQTQRDRLAELVKEFDAILKPLAHSRILYLGTPQCEMSLYNVLSERGYRTRIWPAEYPARNQIDAYGPALAPLIANRVAEQPALLATPTDPGRFTREDLQERLTSYGKAGYALQFMLDTKLSDALKYPLRLADLLVMPIDPQRAPAQFAWGPAPEKVLNELPNVGLVGDRYYRPLWYSDTTAEFTGAIMAIDPAGRGEDQTGYVVLKMLYGYLYLVAAGGFSDGYGPQTLEALAAIALQHKVNEVVIEGNFGDGMFTRLFQPVMLKAHKCAITEVKHSRQKEQRIIDTLEPVLMQHRLVVDPAVIMHDWKTADEPDQSLFYQMVRITKERGALRHDDRLDTLAIGVAYWTEQMAQDAHQKLQAQRAKEHDRQLQAFATNCRFPGLDPAIVRQANQRGRIAGACAQTRRRGASLPARRR